MKKLSLIISLMGLLWVYATPPVDSLAVDSLSTRSFPEIDRQLALQEFWNQQPLSHYSLQNSPEEDTAFTQIKEIFEFCQEQQKFVETITGLEQVALPIGLTGHTNDGFLAEMVIVKATFTPEYMEFDAFARVQTQYQGVQLYFAAEDLKLSHQGGVVGIWKLHMLGQQSLPLFGGKMLFSMIGSEIDQSNGDFNAATYIEFDCDGFKSFGLTADIRVARSLIIPMDENGNEVPNPQNLNLTSNKKQAVGNEVFAGSEINIAASGWNDMLLEVTLPRFRLASLDGWMFNMENAVLDLSESQNSDNVVFPEQYAEQNLFPDGDQNAWKGFYAEQIQVMLPEEFNEKGSSSRTQFTAQEMILDNYGVSGDFYTTISSDTIVKKGDASGWRFKIDSIGVKFAANSLIEGACKGSIKPGTVDSYLNFEGIITPHQYQFSVKVDSADMSMLKGKLVFEQNSYLELVKDNITKKFKADAHLNGYLSIQGTPNSGSTNNGTPNNATTSSNFTSESAGDTGLEEALDFQGIEFQNLHLKSYEMPYITADYFGFQGTLELEGFPVSIDSLRMITPNPDEVGLAFDITLNLTGEENQISGKTSLQVIGKVDANDSEFRNYKFHKVGLSAININVVRSGFKLTGSIEYFQDDPDFGNGFGGNLDIEMEELEIDGSCLAKFGKTEFRYWYADFNFSPSGDQLGKLKIDQIVGGLTYRMRRTQGQMFGNPSHAEYVPDSSLGTGFRAGTKLQFGSDKETFSAKAYLAMQYNSNGGLNNIYFLGEGALMTDAEETNSQTPEEETEDLTQLVSQYVANVFNIETQAEDNSAFLNGDYLNIPRGIHPVTEVAQTGKVGAYVSILKDFENNTFDGLFEVYINLANQIKGTGPNNLAGMARIYSSPSKSYIHIGTPTHRIGLQFPIGSFDLSVQAYFMTGDQLPTQIPPPIEVLEILGYDILDTNRDQNLLSQARGFAVGMQIAISKTFTKGIGYAHLEIGAGIDVMNRQLQGVSCAGMSGPVGNNGWYAFGQVYAYLYGEMGVRVKVLKKRKKIKVIQGGVAALLRGEFPNPVHFEGYVGMSYNVLNGLFKGRLRFKIEFGEECDFVGMSNEVGVSVIGDIAPNNETDVDVFKIPQVAFNFPVDQAFSLESAEGVETIRIKLDHFEIKQDGVPIEGEMQWVDDNTKLNFVATDILPPETQISGLIRVRFEEKIGNNWRPITEENGQEAKEFREFSFTTGTAPDYIPIENIAYAYPVPYSNNFYPEEHATSYIKLKQGQDYLFTGSNAAWQIKGEMYQGENRLSQQNVSYDFSENKVIYNFNGLSTNNNYNINILAYAPGIDPEETDASDLNEVGDEEDYSNSADQTTTVEDESTEETVVVTNQTATAGTQEGIVKSLLEYPFSTSQFGTFSEKLNAIANTSTYVEIITSDIQALLYDTNPYEVFNIPELIGNQYTSDTPYIKVETEFDNSYYQNTIYPLVYEEYPLDGDLTVNRDTQILGMPPKWGNDIPSYYSYYIINENFNSPFVTQRLPYRYNMAMVYKRDFLDLKNKISYRYLSPFNQAKYVEYQYIIDGIFPYLPIGNYRVKYIYSLPGGEFSSSVIKTYNRPY